MSQTKYNYLRHIPRRTNMITNLYSDLRKIDDEELRLKTLMRNIKALLEDRKNSSFLKKIISSKPKTQPKGWV
jgi:hypothetical protein